MRRWLLLWLLALSACTVRDEPYRQEAYVFGTRVEVTVAGMDEAQARPAVAAVLADLDTLHGRLHAWQDGSELTRLNAAFARGEAAAVAPDLAALLQSAARYETASDGLLAPGIGRLIALWGFHADSYTPRQPEPAALQALLAGRPSLSALSFAGGKVSSRNPALALDLGGVAKGWALDRAYGRLKAAGVRSALVNIGGNVIALGSKPDGAPWQVGIQHPRRNEAMASVALADGEAIGTSGDYQRYFELDGRRHCHLVDPRDGNTDCRMQAATVLAQGNEAGLKSDVASKPLYLDGPQPATRHARRMGVRDILVVDGDGRVWVSPSLEKRVHWLVPPASLTLLEQP